MILTWLLLASAASAAAADETVRYSMSPVMANGKLTALAIELRFTGEADGETVLELPNEWAARPNSIKAFAIFASMAKVCR